MRMTDIWRSAVFLLCSGMILFLHMRESVPEVSDRIASQRLFREYVGTEPDPKADPEEQSADFEGLKTENPDIIGWICIPGTQVNEPILRHPREDAYYLTHGAQGEESRLGSIYLHCDAELSDAHVILFGHNIKSGRKFGVLTDYAEEAFAEAHPDVWIQSPEGTLRCAVYSAYACPVDDLTYTAGYVAESAQFEEWIRHTMEQSVIHTGRQPSGKDRVITLSTCTDSGDAGMRFVVHCFWQRETE